MTQVVLDGRLLGERGQVRQAFAEAGIVMNCQIVVCPGLNDGEQLSRTMRDLAQMDVASCAIVPVGVTKYRKGLYKMPVVDEKIANEINKLTDYRTVEEKQPDTPQMAMYRRLMEAKADREEAD